MRKIMVAAAALAVGTGGLLSACQNNNPPSQPQAYSGQPEYASEQQQLIESCKTTVEALRSNGAIGGPVNDNLSRARGVLIFPNLVQAGFFFGAKGGQGVLLVRQGAGWSDPVFVYAANATFGLQIGGEGGQVMFTVMNDPAIHRLLQGNADLGGDLSVAVGPVGAGAQGNVTTANADLVAFSLQQGAFAGATVEGGVVAPRAEFNQAYYGPGATPDPIIRGAFARPGDHGLKLALSNPPPRGTGYGGSR
jgi:lipid-binding SYLF domain-containing protein